MAASEVSMATYKVLIILPETGEALTLLALTNCLSVFDHFVGFVLKGLSTKFGFTS